MRILVTGGAGFIGSKVVEAYINAGHDVAILDNFSHIALGSTVPAGLKAQFHVDVRDTSTVARVVGEYEPDLVSHHAAVCRVREEAGNNNHLDTNIVGTIAVVKACEAAHVLYLVLASSGGTIYGEIPVHTASIDEEVDPAPICVYGTTKVAAEAVARYSSIPGVTILRYSNVYGPGQQLDGEAGVVAKFISNLLLGKDVTVYGNGRQVRDFVYVDDVVYANLAATKKSAHRSMYNIGSGVGTTVNDVLFSIADRLGVDKMSILRRHANTNEVMKNVLNCSRAKDLLEWRVSTSWSEGLTQTIDFYRKELTK